MFSTSNELESRFTPHSPTDWFAGWPGSMVEWGFGLSEHSLIVELPQHRISEAYRASEILKPFPIQVTIARVNQGHIDVSEQPLSPDLQGYSGNPIVVRDSLDSHNFPVVVAHEVGHDIGLLHADPHDFYNVMCPATGPESTRFNSTQIFLGIRYIEDHY